MARDDWAKLTPHSRASGLSITGDKLTKAKATLVKYLQDSLADITDPTTEPRVKGQNRLIQAMSHKPGYYTLTLKAGGKFIYLTDEARDAGKPAFGEFSKDELSGAVSSIINDVKSGEFDKEDRKSVV